MGFWFSVVAAVVAFAALLAYLGRIATAAEDISNQLHHVRALLADIEARLPASPPIVPPSPLEPSEVSIAEGPA